MKVALLRNDFVAGSLICEEAEGVFADTTGLHGSRSRPHLNWRTQNLGEGVV
jgi:fructose-1,6-bisphosphatase/inositol monophosphatase family enzyme